MKNSLFSYFFIILATIALVPQNQLLAPTQAKTSAKPTVVTYVKLAADEQLPKAEHVVTVPTNRAKSTADTAVIAKKLEDIVQSSIKKLSELGSRAEATVKFKYEDSHEFVARMLFERTTDPVSKKTALKMSATVYGYADSVPAIISKLLNVTLAEKSSVPWGKIAGGAVSTMVGAVIIAAVVVSNSGKPGATGNGSGHGSGRRSSSGSGTESVDSDVELAHQLERLFTAQIDRDVDTNEYADRVKMHRKRESGLSDALKTETELKKYVATELPIALAAAPYKGFISTRNAILMEDYPKKQPTVFRADVLILTLDKNLLYFLLKNNLKISFNNKALNEDKTFTLTPGMHTKLTFNFLKADSALTEKPLYSAEIPVRILCKGA